MWILCGLSLARNMSGLVAHNLSGLRKGHQEVIHEMDRATTGDQDHAI